MTWDILFTNVIGMTKLIGTSQMSSREVVRERFDSIEVAGRKVNTIVAVAKCTVAVAKQAKVTTIATDMSPINYLLHRVVARRRLHGP